MNKSLKRALWYGGSLLVVGGAAVVIQTRVSKADWSDFLCWGQPVQVMVEIGEACRVPNEEKLNVTMTAEHYQRMIWRLDQPPGREHWKFAAERGIELVGKNNDPNQAVFFARRRESDQVFRWCNVNWDLFKSKEEKEYTYKINLVGTGTSTCLIDPLIYNN
jgi:hypothetical protein